MKNGSRFKRSLYLLGMAGFAVTFTLGCSAENGDADSASATTLSASDSDAADQTSQVGDPTKVLAQPEQPSTEENSIITGNIPPAADTAEWLGGDLHLHSDHSTDAETTVARWVELAEEKGLDYFVLTDHDNHVKGDITTWYDPDYKSDDMIILYGTEFTTARGHVNYFSTTPWDHMALWDLRDGEAQPYLDEAHEQGLHISINHPLTKDSWDHSFDLNYDSMEIWTSVAFNPQNALAVEKWDQLLTDGRRLPGRGGSDSHRADTGQGKIFNVGDPTTWVLANEKSPQAVINALSAGRISISYSPAAERIDITADGDGDGEFEAIIGDNLPATEEPVSVKVDIVDFREGATYTVKVIKNGEVWREETVQESSTVFVDDEGTGERAYYRAEVRGNVEKAAGLKVMYQDLIGYTNPIYFGYE